VGRNTEGAVAIVFARTRPGLRARGDGFLWMTPGIKRGGRTLSASGLGCMDLDPTSPSPTGLGPVINSGSRCGVP
jgi:hypothetical protein